MSPILTNKGWLHNMRYIYIYEGIKINVKIKSAHKLDIEIFQSLNLLHEEVKV